MDLTVSKLALMDSTGDRDRSTTNAIANWAIKPKITPPMMHSDPIQVATATNSAVRNTGPRLRGLKNDPMLTGFPSAMSRAPVRIAAAMKIAAMNSRM